MHSGMSTAPILCNLVRLTTASLGATCLLTPEAWLLCIRILGLAGPRREASFSRVPHESASIHQSLLCTGWSQLQNALRGRLLHFMEPRPKASFPTSLSYHCTAGCVWTWAAFTATLPPCFEPLTAAKPKSAPEAQTKKSTKKCDNPQILDISW